MFNTTHICNTMILSPDVVRMNAARESAIRDYTKNNGIIVGASIDNNVDGSVKSIDLFGGTAVQREAFRDGLAAVVLG